MNSGFGISLSLSRNALQAEHLSQVQARLPGQWSAQEWGQSAGFGVSATSASALTCEVPNSTLGTKRRP